MNVEQEKVGLEARQLLVRFGHGPCPPQQLILRAAQEHLQSGADHWMVVDQ